MKKVLIYAMEGQKMCFMHALMNAVQLKEAGCEVKIILEGQSLTLVKTLEEEKNPMYLKMKEEKVIAGACLACSKALGVYEEIEKSGLEFLNDMNGHAGVKKYVEDDYQVLVF